MGNSMFRLLRADEIDARIGSTKAAKDGGSGGVSLLLYKDARCDMTILDETVGPFGWKREHSRDNANCKVSLWDEQKGQWISKEDVGSPSNTEAEKGLASDSFKRACTNWGIGRELYTAPFIWIPGDANKLKYEKFKVKEIGYLEETRVINKLVITNRRGETVYDMKQRVNPDIIEPEVTPQDTVKAAQKEARKPAEVTTGATVPPVQQEAPEAPKKPETVADFLKKNVAQMKTDFTEEFDFGKARMELITAGEVPNVSSAEMTLDQARDLVSHIYSHCAAMLKKVS